MQCHFQSTSGTGGCKEEFLIMLKQIHNHTEYLLFKTQRHLLDYQRLSQQHPAQEEERGEEKNSLDWN